MRQQHFPIRLLATTGFALVALLGLWVGHADLPALVADPAKPEPPAKPPKSEIYDQNPQHLWNRLYAALYIRTTQDGQEYGQDGLDPLLWPSSKYLLTKPRYQQAISLLDEFLTKSGEKLIKDPLKRAILQHDLWAIFDWLADPHLGYSGYPGEKPDDGAAERRELRKRLAQALQRLALSRKQIDALPDNYAAAVAAKVFPAKHDPSASDKAFLPPDLLTAGGPWLVLGAEGLAAPNHVAFVQGRSAFFVLMNLPQGRKATLAYLEKLNGFPNPLMPQSAAERNGHVAGKPGLLLNPDLPQFPAGTQFALVRQMMLMDDQGKIRPTRIIENVQLRVFLDVPRTEDLAREQRNASDSFLLLRKKQMTKNDFYEFQLRRKDLFAGKAGGLHAIKSEEQVFGQYSVADEDIFEKRPEDLNRRQPEDGRERGQSLAPTENLRSSHSCNACHGQGPGIHGVLSYGRVHPPELVESTRRDQEEVAMDWKLHRFGWGILQGLLEKRARK
jgi:hypothetical protein